MTCIIIPNLISCSKKNEFSDKKNSTLNSKEDSECDKALYRLFHNSSLKIVEKYEVRIDTIRNDTIIIKTFTRNNLSNSSETKQITESVVGWFIIPPKRDALYLSQNALDPIDPKFKKIITNEKSFKDFLNCNNLKTTHQMKKNIKFTDLFNEGTIIKFTPNNLNNNTSEIKDFKENLEIYLTENPSPKDFEVENLSYLINNETFFDLQYYTDSSWLQYFITNYNIEVTQLNNLMELAINQEDYNAVIMLIDNHYIISQRDLLISYQAKQETQNKIQQNNEDGYKSYIVSKSRIDSIIDLFKEKFKVNKIIDPDGFTNLRKDKTASSEILQKIKSGEHIEVSDNSGDWFLVKTKEGKEGYVHKSRIKN